MIDIYYNFAYIFEFFKDQNILKKDIKCPIWNNIMDIVDNTQYIDNKCYRCRSSQIKHDVKISIRKWCFIKELRLNIISIDFLIYDFFLKKISVKKAFIEHMSKTMKLNNVSYQSLTKLYIIIR